MACDKRGMTHQFFSPVRINMIAWGLLARGCNCAPPILAAPARFLVLSDDEACPVSFRTSYRWHAGGITRKTIRLFEELVSRFPDATYYAKVDCDARLVRPGRALVAAIGDSDYFGSCEGTHEFWSRVAKNPVRLDDGRAFPYAQGGAYFLHTRVVRRVLERARALVNASRVHRHWEDAMIGASARVVGVNLTCAGDTIRRERGIKPTTLIIHPVK